MVLVNDCRSDVTPVNSSDSDICIEYVSKCLHKEKHCDGLYLILPGERVPSKNVCKRCNCSDKGEMMCDEIQCTRCPGEVVPVEGRCCGDCFKRGVFLKPGVGCAKCGFVYNFGECEYFHYISCTKYNTVYGITVKF